MRTTQVIVGVPSAADYLRLIYPDDIVDQMAEAVLPDWIAVCCDNCREEMWVSPKQMGIAEDLDCVRLCHVCLISARDQGLFTEYTVTKLDDIDYVPDEWGTP